MIHDLLEDSSTDGNVAGEGAFLVNVGSLDGGLGGLEACKNQHNTLISTAALERAKMKERQQRERPDERGGQDGVLQSVSVKRAIVPATAATVRVLTESNFFVESNAAAGLLGKDFFGGKENAVLLLEGFFSLEISHLWRSFQRK